MNSETRQNIESTPFFTGRKRKATKLIGPSMKNRKIQNSTENKFKEALQIKGTITPTSTPLKREITRSSTYNDSRTANAVSSRGTQTNIFETPVKKRKMHPKEYLRAAAQSIRNRVSSKKSRGRTKQSKTSPKPRWKKVVSRKSQTKGGNRKKGRKENNKKRSTSPPRFKLKKKVKEKKASKRAAANRLRKNTSPQFTLSFLNLKIDDQGQLVNANVQQEISENETDIPPQEQNQQVNFFSEDGGNIMEIESSLENPKYTYANKEIHTENNLEQPCQELSELSPYQNPEQWVNINIQDTKFTNESNILHPEEQNREMEFLRSREEENIMDLESPLENSETDSKDMDVNMEMHLEKYYQEPSPFKLNLPTAFTDHADKVLNTTFEKNWNEINTPNAMHVSKFMNETINNENSRLEENCLNVYHEAVTDSASIKNLSTYLENTTTVTNTNADKPLNEVKENKIQVFESSNERKSNGNSRSYIRLININQAISESESTQNLSIYTQNTNEEMHAGNGKSLNEIQASKTIDETTKSENMCNTNKEMLKFLKSISSTDKNFRSIPVFSQIIPKTQEASTRTIFTEIDQQNRNNLNNSPGSTNEDFNREDDQVPQRYIQTAFSMLPLALPRMLRFLYYTYSN